MQIEKIIDLETIQKHRRVMFMSKEDAKPLHKACLGNAEARLQLVKSYLNLVVELAAEYARQTEKPFPQMVKAGTLAVVRAADNFHCHEQVEFHEHVKFHVSRAMESVKYV